MNEQTKKYLEDGCKEQVDFSRDISYWLLDNWDPNKTDEELKEELNDYIFSVDAVSELANEARKQADGIIDDVRKMEKENGN